ncbi:VanZ family protein [Bacillus horti]|uniref:VanZ family protein n=1 Tax=Caldalkalibacillus horti TaxID=77523 RepID=UPI0031E0DE94
MLPFILWIAVIMTVSNQSFEQQSIQPRLMDYITEDKLRETLPDVSVSYGVVKIESKEDPFRFVEFIFRKSAHLFAYGLLATFACVAFIPYPNKPRFRWIALISLLSVIIVASIDELNQAQMDSRTGAFQDVVLDFVGGCLALTIIGLIIWKKRSKAKRKER